MSCIVLVGGIIGCGKTTFVEYCHEKGNHFFKNGCTNGSSVAESESYKIYKITFDDLCTIPEQAELMKTHKGLRNFRVDLLLAAEHFVSSTCGSECKLGGPLSERSQKLLQKMEMLNNSCSAVSKAIFFIEDNFYYRSMRYDWFQIARRANIGFCEVFLQCSLTIAIERNSLRGYSIPEQKIKLMMSCMEFPNPEKYKWEKYSVIFDSTKQLQLSPLNEIVDIIKKASNNPAELLISEEKIKAQNLCSKNAIHQADKILRKLISSKVSYLKSSASNTHTLKTLISCAIDVRQELLNDLRQGTVQVPENSANKLKTNQTKHVR
ncbi:hypothetical protein JTE90_009387 [Oedothorax gibbosus]|uniref:Uncharacterized protein n=1 Tax=Oedothorax gibbosus TaxID=931172 RepID=A0AAV6VUT8_9ARAC|nr:hypothetical protein JTE90_009387 [Oedothorax gibbosus]